MPDNAIWAVTGPEHDARMARELAWIATGGQTGIVGPESLEVRAQNTPNNTVRIMPGGMSIAATSQSAAIGYTSAPWQSYMRAIYSPLTVEIQPTGSSGGRTDVVGIVVDDPEFEGTSPDVDSHQYWRPHVVQNAGNNATRPEHFASLGRPFLPLAQVRIPANTATITNSMITDIRRLSVSRSSISPLLGVVRNGQDSRRIGVSQTSWTSIYEMSNIPVPDWASLVKLSVSLGPVYASGGAVNGEFRVVASGIGGSGSTTGTRYTLETMFVESDPRDQIGGSDRFYLQNSAQWNVYPGTPLNTLSLDFQVRRTHPNRDGDLVVPGSNALMNRMSGIISFEESARRTS